MCNNLEINRNPCYYNCIINPYQFPVIIFLWFDKNYSLIIKTLEQWRISSRLSTINCNNICTICFVLISRSLVHHIFQILDNFDVLIVKVQQPVDLQGVRIYSDRLNARYFLTDISLWNITLKKKWERDLPLNVPSPLPIVRCDRSSNGTEKHRDRFFEANKRAMSFPFRTTSQNSIRSQTNLVSLNKPTNINVHLFTTIVHKWDSLRLFYACIYMYTHKYNLGINLQRQNSKDERRNSHREVPASTTAGRGAS